MPPLETRRALVVVRTDPSPAAKGAEVSCPAAITEDRKWMRLFPIPYRFLDPDRRFHKYQWIEASVRKASDARPESYNIDIDSIRLLGDPVPSDHGWRQRKEILFPLRAHCLCCLKRARDEHKFPTLGLFRPGRIERLILEPETGEWSADQLALLQQGQGSLLDTTSRPLLEKLPFTFKYAFRCDEDSCGGHELSCADWEMAQAWRKWKEDYGDEWEGAFRQKFESDMIHKFDTHFYVGTVHKHPHTWIIVGLFYPPKAAQSELFE